MTEEDLEEGALFIFDQHGRPSQVLMPKGYLMDRIVYSIGEPVKILRGRYAGRHGYVKDIFPIGSGTISYDVYFVDGHGSTFCSARDLKPDNGLDVVLDLL